MAVERVEPPLAAREREMLEAWLDFHRDTLAVKCEGLTGDRLRERAVPPSSLSLLGLVRHMAEGDISGSPTALGTAAPVLVGARQMPAAAARTSLTVSAVSS